MIKITVILGFKSKKDTVGGMFSGRGNGENMVRGSEEDQSMYLYIYGDSMKKPTKCFFKREGEELREYNRGANLVKIHCMQYGIFT
jgi:hypothetical protein